jgi:hypothetical protein
MNNKIAAFCFACILSMHLHCRAQADDLFGKFKIFEGGLVFGSNITKIEGDMYSGYHKIGIQAGGVVYVHFNASFGISMEFLYAQKGARGGNVKESIYLGTYIDKYYLNINYVELPLMLHFKAGLDYEAGIAYARLVKSDEWAEADVPVIIKPAINFFSKEDFEYVGGVSLQLNKHWRAGVRFQYSIHPIRKWEQVPERYKQYGVNEYNNVVVLRVIYML